MPVGLIVGITFGCIAIVVVAVVCFICKYGRKAWVSLFKHRWNPEVMKVAGLTTKKMYKKITNLQIIVSAKLTQGRLIDEYIHVNTTHPILEDKGNIALKMTRVQEQRQLHWMESLVINQ